MNPDDENRNHDDFSRDADKFHIAPEYGEQGEGPGEQPVRRVNTTDGFKKPVSINVTEVKPEDVIKKAPASSQSPFNHGADDVMQYFTTEKIEEATEEIKEVPQIKEEVITHKPQSAPRKKKKSTLVSTIAIVLITVLITAVAVFAILVLTQGHSKDNKITTVTTTTVETDSITCTKSDATDDEKSAAGDATAINITVIANYTKKDMDDYSVMKRYTYENPSAAEAGLKKVKDAYMNKYVEMLEMNVDPFSSTYAQKDTEVTESHFAEASDITSENIDLINIPKPSNGTTPDISVVESTLKTSGYTCKVKSAE